MHGCRGWSGSASRVSRRGETAPRRRGEGPSRAHASFAEDGCETWIIPQRRKVGILCRVATEPLLELGGAAPNRPPLQSAVAGVDPIELVEPEDLVTVVHALCLRNAASTTGSMRSTPSVRSSRFALPAQSSNA